MTEQLIHEIEALRVGPDEILVLHLKEDWEPEFVDGLVAALEDAGLKGRSLVIFAEGLEFAVVKK